MAWPYTLTSYLAQNDRLREQTIEAYYRSESAPRDLKSKLDFYIAYLEDVVPTGLTVFHFPVGVDERGQPIVRNPEREEIQIQTHLKQIFMSGLVSLEHNTRKLEETACDEGYTKWGNGDFTRDWNNWRFFTCHTRIQFFSGKDDDWEESGDFDPIEDAKKVTEYLQQELEKPMVQQSLIPF